MQKIVGRKLPRCDKITTEKNDLLSICIPTCNHAEPLAKCLEALIPQAREHNIPIYVSDNASTDNTLEVLKSFEKIYPFLYFRIQDKNLGVDINMVSVARMASTKYVWTLGSRRILLPRMLNKVYDILNESDLDLLVLNDQNSRFVVPESKRYSSAEKVFRELNRHLTGLGFQILPLEAWKSEIVRKYESTEWTVFGLTFEYIASKPNLDVFFLSDPCAASSGVSNWIPRFFQVWTNWKHFIPRAEPTYKEYINGMNKT
jgi:glycosyltransferase involved in cell wall biosynthesis